MSQSPKLYSLQAGRGLAAFAVIFYHAALILHQPEYGAHVTFPNAEIGILGVNYFFVLSGFIILMAHFKDIGNPSGAANYLYRRVTRIYPIYWIYLTAYIAAAAVGLGHADFKWQWDQFLNAFGLFYIFEIVSPLPLKVAWTLFFEVQFYLFFLLLILNRRLGIVAFGAWFCAMAAYYVAVPEARSAGQETSTFLSSWNVHFLCGMAAFLAYRKIPDKWWPYLTTAGAGIVCVFVCWRLRSDLSASSIHAMRNEFIPLLALGFGLFILGLVLAERRGSLKVPSFLTFLGDASYSVYLVHSSFISLGVILLNKVGLIERIGAKPVYFALVIGALAAGCLGHVLIERPLLAMLSRRKASSTTSDAGASTQAIAPGERPAV